MTYQATVQATGEQFTVRDGESVLSAALRQGVGMPYACQNGACGSCKCQLVSGEVIHESHSPEALSPAEEARGLILACKAQARADLVLSVRTVAEHDIPPRKMPARIVRLDKLCPDVARVWLQLPAADPFLYRAGQYIEVLLPGGVRRAYSMANAPERLHQLQASGAPTLELHVRHMPGGVFTDALFERLQLKDLLRIEGPFGGFGWPDSASPTVPRIFLASGTGFAPLKALLESLEAQPPVAPIHLYWGARIEADLYLHDWCVQATQRWPWLRYTPVLSHAPDGPWSGRRGLVHDAVMQDHPDLRAFEVFACGAPAMVHAARRDFTERAHLPDTAFFSDAFLSLADATPPRSTP